MLNVQTMNCTLSPISCPLAAPFSAVLLDDRERVELLVFGYLRRSEDMIWIPVFERTRFFMPSDDPEPRGILVPLFTALPVELMLFLVDWATTDWIHLLPESPTDSHWKIAAHHLIPWPWTDVCRCETCQCSDCHCK